MTMLEQMKGKREQIMKTAARHGVSNIRVFGSVAHGGERPDSDVDFLVDVSGQVSSWFPAGLVADLERLVGRPVDVVTSKGVNPLLRDLIFKEAVEL